MKKIITVLFVLLLLFPVFSQNTINSPSILSYRKALVCFDENEYGLALLHAEDAILLRTQQVENELRILEKSLSTKTVKAAGDRIENVIAVLEERGETDCISIIKSYTNKNDYNYFNDSISNLKEYISSQKVFPEAQKLIGDIYKLEGEYDFAENYYKKALENKDVLDIQDEQYEILYLLADISKLKGDYDKMEIRLLNVIGTNQLEKNKSISRAIKNTVKTNKTESVNKTFQLYRTYDFYSLKAYSLLADYYFEIDELDKAFNYSALAVLNGFTKICNLLEKRNLEYSFTDLEGFFVEVQNYPDIIQWGRDNYVWKNFNVFADICDKLNYNKYAFELLKIIAFNSPEKYWQQNAVLKLDTVDGIKDPD